MNRNVTALILIVLAIGIYFTFTQNIIDQAMVEKGINDQYSEAITNAVKLIEKRKEINDDYNAISPTSRARLDRMIPSATNNIHLIIDLTDMASNLHHLQLKNIKAEVVGGVSPGIQTPVPGQGPGTVLIASSSLSQVKITFSVSATYDQFREFLRDIQSNLRIMDVSHLTIKATDSGVYEFQVELRAYWLKS